MRIDFSDPPRLWPCRRNKTALVAAQAQAYDAEEMLQTSTGGYSMLLEKKYVNNYWMSKAN